MSKKKNKKQLKIVFIAIAGVLILSIAFNIYSIVKNNKLTSEVEQKTTQLKKSKTKEQKKYPYLVKIIFPKNTEDGLISQFHYDLTHAFKIEGRDVRIDDSYQNGEKILFEFYIHEKNNKDVQAFISKLKNLATSDNEIIISVPESDI